MASSPSNGHVDERTRAADEETPLLGEASSSTLSDDDTDREIVIIKEELSNKQLAFALGSVYVGVFLGAVDSTVVATLAAPISTSFNSLSLLSWLASSYLIANAACQPISGRLTDIFSRRSGLVVSNVLFAIGNLMCGVAGSEWTMIAGRVVAGMGGGGMYL
jgi:predicted MFS family arabinose efflux permease